MKFDQFLSIVELKKNSVEQLKNLAIELKRQIEQVSRNESSSSQDQLKQSIRRRYARIANRAIRDLAFREEDFKSDEEL